RRAAVDATTIRLGSAEVDVASLPSFLTSAISDIVIDLDFLPAGLERTDIEATDAGLSVRLHGSGVNLDWSPRSDTGAGARPDRQHAPASGICSAGQHD